MGYQVRFAFWWFTLAAVGRGAILFIFLWYLLAQLISGLPFLFPFITLPSSLQLEGLELCGQGREGPFAAPSHWGWRVLVSPGPKRTLKGKGWGGHWNLKPPTPESGHQIPALGTSEPYSPNPARDPARLRVLRAAWVLWWWPGPGQSQCARAPAVLWHSTTPPHHSTSHLLLALVELFSEWRKPYLLSSPNATQIISTETSSLRLKGTFFWTHLFSSGLELICDTYHL